MSFGAATAIVVLKCIANLEYDWLTTLANLGGGGREAMVPVAVTHGKWACFQEVNHGPAPNRSSSSAPQFCGFSIYVYTLKMNDQIRRGKSWGGACF